MRIERVARRGLEGGLKALTKLRGGKPLDFEPVVKLLGMRLFAKRFYGALIDAHGASYADVDETIGRVHSLKPEAWAKEWRRTAERFESVGREASAAGRGHTAAELLTKASMYYRFGEMSMVSDTPEREQLQRDSIEAYLLAGKFMDPPLEPVRVDIEGVEAPAYLRVPRHVVRPAVVLIVPGLGMFKEHGDFPQEVVLARGMAALTVDLPGQGESRQLLALNQPNGLKVVTAAIDYLVRRSDLDGDRLGVIGTSMGAAAAMLAASSDRRIKALVEIAGFYYPSAWWDRFPQEIKEFLRYIMGAADQDQLLELVRPINLEGHVREITCPILVVHGQQDQIVPFGESDLIYAEARAPKDRLIFPTGDHGCVNVGEARPLIGDWIAQKLCAQA